MVDSGQGTAYQHRNSKGAGVSDDGDDGVHQARDAERLKALEERLAQARRDDRLTPPGMDKFAHANQAWRMVIELVAGLAVGFGVGFGLDRLLGEQVRRLRAVAHRVVWVNPHKGRTGYEPLAGGMVAALPSVDAFVAGHSMAAFEELTEVIQHAGRPR